MLVAVVSWDWVLATCKGEPSYARKKKIMVCCTIEEVEELAGMVEDYMAVVAACLGGGCTRGGGAQRSSWWLPAGLSCRGGGQGSHDEQGVKEGPRGWLRH